MPPAFLVLKTALCSVLISFAAPALAQQSQVLENTGVLQSLILTISPERLFGESDFGRRISREIEDEGASIAAENREIEAELTEEERELTELRDTLAPEDFRDRADAFDEKVQRLRREQDEKGRNLGQRSEEARRALLSAAQPVLADLMRESGAVAVLDRRTVLLSVDAVDITDKAIARVNAQFGDGSDILPLRE